MPFYCTLACQRLHMLSHKVNLSLVIVIVDILYIAMIVSRYVVIMIFTVR